MRQMTRTYPIYAHTDISPERLDQAHDAAFAWVQAELPFQSDADYTAAGDVENVQMSGSVEGSHIGRQLYSYTDTALSKLTLARNFQASGANVNWRLSMLQAAGKAAALGHALSVMVGYAARPDLPLDTHRQRASNLFACSSAVSNATASYVRPGWTALDICHTPLWDRLAALDAVLPAPLQVGATPPEAVPAAYLVTRETTRFFMDMLVDYAQSPLGTGLVLPQPGVPSQLLLSRTEDGMRRWQAPSGAIDAWRQAAASRLV